MPKPRSDDRSSAISRALERSRSGDSGAQRELFSLLHEDLSQIAKRALSKERQNHTLDPVALVGEAYLKLAPSSKQWEGRTHFLACAALVMRQVLVNHARAKKAKKRGEGEAPVTVNSGIPAQKRPVDVLELDDALHRLERLSPRQEKIVVLYYFAGLSAADIAREIELSTRTVRAELAAARSFLRRILDPRPPPDA
jgi:RNA polymerase sigma factor (TIGR02999 family)